MFWRYALLVALAFAVACNEPPLTAPSELAGPRPAPSYTAPASSSNLAFHALEDEPEDTEDPEDQGLCARSGGFWCQNQNGQNPNLTEDDWMTYLADAVDLLAAEGVTTSEDEVAEGVCDVRRQLFRQLASLALNLAAGFVDPTAPLTGEDAALGTVGDAFAEGARIYALGDAVPFEERQSIKDTMDRINNNVSLDNECTPEDDALPEEDDGTADACSATTGLVTICHIPPGNPSLEITITIGAPAWPAHQAHGDRCGPC